MSVAPTLPTACGSLHLAGRRSPEASLLSPVQTCSCRFGAAGSSPEGPLRLRSGKASPAALACVNAMTGTALTCFAVLLIYKR